MTKAKTNSLRLRAARGHIALTKTRSPSIWVALLKGRVCACHAQNRGRGRAY